MFEKTRLKLTAWYLLIIMCVSILFTLVIYSMVNSEFVRLERMQIRIQENIQDGRGPFRGPRFVQINHEEIQEARMRLILTLGGINLFIFLFSGGAGYFLAGRTLKPIKKSMDEQKRFVSDSSHELRTPITSLRSEIEVALRNKSISGEMARKILKSNLEEVISLQNLSDKLLELAQNGTIKTRDYTSFSISESIVEAIRKTEKMAKAKKIIIKYPKNKIQINGIKDRIDELFVILIDNAIKYSKSGGEIEIKSSKKNKEVIVTIIDNGIGIKEKDLPFIFDRFYRAEKSRSEKGFGLGLSIAKKIVENHKGKISVESTPNKKTEFTVTLPLA